MDENEILNELKKIRQELEKIHSNTSTFMFIFFLILFFWIMILILSLSSGENLLNEFLNTL